MNHAVDQDAVAADAPALQAGADLGDRCEPGAWLRLAPALARVGLSADAPGICGDWLTHAHSSSRGQAQRLFQAMSRHPWRIQAKPPARQALSPLRGATARLQVLITVQGRGWLVTLAAVPHWHAVHVQPLAALAHRAAT